MFAGRSCCSPPLSCISAFAPVTYLASTRGLGTALMKAILTIRDLALTYRMEGLRLSSYRSQCFLSPRKRTLHRTLMLQDFRRWADVRTDTQIRRQGAPNLQTIDFASMAPASARS